MILKKSKVKAIKMSLYRFRYRYEGKEKFVEPKMRKKKTKEKQKERTQNNLTNQLYNGMKLRQPLFNLFLIFIAIGRCRNFYFCINIVIWCVILLCHNE